MPLSHKDEFYFYLFIFNNLFTFHSNVEFYLQFRNDLKLNWKATIGGKSMISLISII